MRKKTIFIIILIAILVTAFSDFKTESITVTKKDYKQNEQTEEVGKFADLIMASAIDKRGENDNFLSGVKFNMTTYNNVFSYESEESDNYFVFKHSNISFAKAYEILSKEQKELISSIKTTKDFNKLYPEAIFCQNLSEMEFKSTETNMQNMDEDNPNGILCTVTLPTVFYLEEVSIPTGYAKDKYIVPGGILLDYYIPDISLDETTSDNQNSIEFLVNLNNPLDLVHIRVESFSNYEGYNFKYGDTNVKDLVGINTRKAYETWSNQANKNLDCSNEIGNILSKNTIDYTTGIESNIIQDIASLREEEKTSLEGKMLMVQIEKRCPLLLHNKKGEANLKIETFVNDGKNITVSKNATLKYKIVINNTGTADAVDNIVSITIPEGLQYVENSAGEYATYNNGKIIWELNRIPAGEEIVLTYEAIISQNTYSIDTFITEATINSYSLKKEIDSNKTKVSTNLKNPKTNTQLFLIEGIISLILGISAYLYLHLKQKYTKKFIFLKQ